MSNRNVAANPDKTETLVGVNSEFKGMLLSETGIRIEGIVTGDIQCKGDVTIGHRGIVLSNIEARNIVIGGTVQGKVCSKGKLTVCSSGKLIGDHTSTSIHIEKGGVIVGRRNIPISSEERSVV